IYYIYHFNLYYGDYEGKDENIDADQPYDDDTPTIEQEIESTLKVTGAGQEIYYSDKEEYIYITVMLYNPDDFEILSFVLNGKKYAIQMFEDGSDLENIIVKLQVGDAGGIYEYTIDEIKYVDGTDIKDVLLNGDTVVKVGVRSDDQTYATISNETHDLDSISFDVKIVDLYSLIAYSEGYAMAVLYDGDSLVQSVDLELGTNTVEFTSLTPNTLYQYAVVALYDDLSGTGTAFNYLYKNAVYTDTIVLFDNVSVAQEGISFGYSWYEGYSASTITQLTLTTGGKTQTLDSAATSAAGLLSDTEYTLAAYYTNLDGETESISLTFTTLEKATPSVEISALNSTQTSVDYELAITDTDGVGTLTSVTLTHGETSYTSDTVTGTFENLLSNNTYTLTVIYTYNLNDDTGDHTAEVTQEITTQAKATPEVEISTLASEQESVSYGLAITDIDCVGTLTSVTLTLGETSYTATEATGTFDGLLSNNTYTLTVIYTYNLNDGTGDHTAEVTQDITTQAKATPDVEISVLTSEQESVSYGLAITDTDSVGSLTSVTLTLGETSYTATEATGTFENLLSDNTYTLTVIYTYNLNDGTGDHTKTVTKNITTKAKATPTVDIQFTDSNTTGLTFGLTYTDTDSIGEITAIGLYNGITLVEEVTDFTQTTLSFTGLDSYIKYTIIVDYKYDLNDGDGEQQASESLSAYTDPVIEFKSISVLNTSAVSEGETIVIQATMNNPSKATFSSVVVNGEIYSVSDVSTSTSLRAEIVNEGQFEGGDTPLTITQIICTLGGNTYTVDISSGNTANVFINGELTVNDISVVRLNDSNEYEETYYGFYSEQLYYQITLSNATEYEVYSVTIGGTTYDSTDITMSSDYQTAYIAISDSWYGWKENTLSSISYSNSSLDKTKPIDISVAYMRLGSDEITEITTAEQLLKVSGYGYYKLMNDIDLSSYEWANIDNYMYGVFDGNGYSIKNMSAVTTYTDTDLYLGLFKYVSGVVTNLNITGALYMVTLNNSTGNNYNIYAGGIAAYGNGNNVIDNCNIEISIQITNNNTSGDVRIGGVLGEISANYVTIINSNVEAVISLTYSSSSWSYIGGVVGQMYCYKKASIFGLEVNLTAIISVNNYYASAYLGEYYYNSSWYQNDSGHIVKNSTADYTITYKNNDVVYYGIDGFEFSYSNGAYTLTGYYGSDTDIILPDRVDGNTYAIGNNAFASNTLLTSITISSGVTSIGSYAFSSCTAEIIWADDITITEIGRYAFAGYAGTSITLPDCVTTIDERAFQSCTATSITIGSGVTTINSYVFYDCTAEIIWADNIAITEIGRYAFAGYAGTSITLPDCVTTIDERAFQSCTATSITIGSGVTTINSYVFYDCTAEIIWADNIAITEIGSYAFAYYAGTSITIPASVTTLCSCAFNGCTAEIIWSENITLKTISGWTFAWYSGTSITIPDSVTTIDAYAFYDCTSLTSVTIGSGVTSIGSYAFEGCTSLTEIYIPANVTTIGNNVFNKCTCLIVAEAESKPDGWYSGWNSDCLVLYGLSAIPTEEVTYTFETNGGSEVESITAVYLTSLPTTTKDGYAFGGWYTTADFTGKAVTSPYCSLTDITLYARWYDLSGVTQSEGLEIENGVIVGIGSCTDTILTICMPIADSAFSGCTQITAVYFYDGCTSIGYQAFDYCSNLKTAYFYQTETPTLGSDIFANTWDASDFAVYVLANLYSEYQNVSDSCWQNSIVSANKLYTI
ncbi:MAG: leucine-rich repeat protein, partial [Clostridia bacterium]|nr:leucine-rich repeat protein [Clostridia bacterium]